MKGCVDLKNILSKFIRKLIVVMIIVCVFNFIKVVSNEKSTDEANNIKTEGSTVNTSSNTKAAYNLKNFESESSGELAKGKIIIRIVSVNAKDSSITITAEIENNSEYVVKKSLYNFHLIDSARKRIQPSPADSNNFGSDIEPNSKQTFHIVFTNVDLSAKPMRLKGELFIPDPRVRDDRFNLEVVY